MTTTTNDLLQGNDNDLTSASNAIDQMISMTVDHTDPNSDKTDNTRTNWSPRFVFHKK